MTIPNPLPPHLTPRERDVLVLSSKGCRVGEVATRLGMSSGTVQVRLKSIYKKLDVHSKVEAAVWAAKEGWV
jgi:two-component system nitrate/nitrite response regulator NarL